MFTIVPIESDNWTHELVGEADSDNPLEGSIEKWDTVAQFKAENPGALIEDGGQFTCPLCLLYWPGDCAGCLIAEHTGYPGCMNTPYDDYDQCPSLRNAVAELDFLRMLRRCDV